MVLINYNLKWILNCFSHKIFKACSLLSPTCLLHQDEDVDQGDSRENVPVEKELSVYFGSLFILGLVTEADAGGWMDGWMDR